MINNSSEQFSDADELLQAVFDSATNGVAVMKILYDESGQVEDFTILLFNAYSSKWIGDTKYKGKRYSEIFPTVKKTGILEKFKEVAQTGAAAHFERLYDGEGMRHWFCFTAVKQRELLVVTTEDITERKQSEEAIRQSQERFRFALKAGHLGSWEFDLATQALEASDLCKLNFGQPLDQPFSYQTLLNCIYPEDRQRQEEAVNATISTGKDYDIEYRVIWPDHTIHWVNIRGQLYYGNEGKPVSMIGVSQDITQRKETEIALNNAWETADHQQRLYNAVTNNTPDLIYVFDPHYRFTYANDALLAMWDKTVDEAIGKGLRENGYEEWHAQMHEREIDEVVATRKPIRGTVSFPHAVLGQRMYDYIFTPVFNEQGVVEAIAGSSRDITDLKRTEVNLKESESRFRALVNATSDVVYRMNADWTEMRQLEGRGFLNDTGNPIQDWIHKYIAIKDRERVLAGITQAISQKSTFEMEHQVVDMEGSLGWTFSRAIPILDNAGNILEWFGAASDVTERKKAETALRESEQNLRNLVLQAPTGICVMDATTLVSEIVNEKFVEIAGKPFEAIMGKHYWDTFAEAAPYYASALQEVIDKGKPFYAKRSGTHADQARKGRTDLCHLCV